MPRARRVTVCSLKKASGQRTSGERWRIADPCSVKPAKITANPQIHFRLTKPR
jgi:hypothetical protein